MRNNDRIQTKNRMILLDVARAFAIISVVFCHSVESFFYMYQDRSILWGMLSTGDKIFDLAGITFGRLGVPIFLFLTGALMLGRPMEKETISKFYKKKWLSLFITMQIWIFIWTIFLMLYKNAGGETETVSFGELMKCLFLQRNVPTIMPAWYIPMILGIYLFLPFVAIVVNKVHVKDMVFPFIITTIIFFGLPTWNLIALSIGGSMIENPIIDIGFSGGVYGVYIVLGYWVNEGVLQKIKTPVLAFITVIMAQLCVLLQYKLADVGIFYKLEYNVLFLSVCSICIFELIRRIPEYTLSVQCKSVCTFLSRISLLVFFLHNPIQYTIYLTGVLNHMERPYAVILMFVLSFGISVFGAWVIKLLGPISKYLGFK